MEYNDQEEEKEGLDQGHSTTTLAPPPQKPRYKECLKNQAVGIGAHAVDGCREFTPAGEDGSLESLKCAACTCHRNFHRRANDAGVAFPFRLPDHAHGHYGYLHVAPLQQRPRVVPLSLPSSSGGGGGSGSRDEAEDYYSDRGGRRKRFRTKFTAEQKTKMLDLATRLDWKIRKEDEETVHRFCIEAGIGRHVLKVWMHNNKQTLGKKT